MASLPQGFDPNQHDPLEDFAAIPAGEYLVAIVASEEKTTKAGTGKYLKLQFEVLAGEFKGRRLWKNINTHNPNRQAVEIGMRELSGICHATGVMHPQDSSQFHNIPMVAKVRCKKRKGTDEMENVVAQLSAPAQQAATSQGYTTPGVAQQHPPQQPAPTGAPAW